MNVMPKKMQPIISFRKVSRKYTQGEHEVYAIKDINLSILPGEFVAIVGKSGSGKSTILNVMTKIDSYTSGEITVNNRPMNNVDDVAEWRGKNLGIIFQFFQLMPTLTILENVLLPMDLVKTVPSSKRKTRAIDLLKQVGLFEHKDKFPSELSGGEQQRCAIARALANDPPILIADEPTGNLDSTNAAQVYDLFGEFKKGNKTIIMATHERDEIPYVDRKIELLDGQIISGQIK